MSLIESKRPEEPKPRAIPILAVVLVVSSILALAAVGALTAYAIFGGGGEGAAEAAPPASAATLQPETATTQPAVTTTALEPTTTTWEATTSTSDATTSTTAPAAPTTTAQPKPAVSPAYAGKGYRMMTLDITIPSPHCEQALLSSVRNEPGVLSTNIMRRNANNTIIYDPKTITREKLLELTAAVGGSELLDDREV